MARLAGLEPATLGLEGRCSIQMSYRRITVTNNAMVGVEGFEPPTSCSQSRRATRLRYTPFKIRIKDNTWPYCLRQPKLFHTWLSVAIITLVHQQKE